MFLAMRRRILLTALLALAALLPREMQGFSSSYRGASVEWYVNISDLVAVVEVTNAELVEPESRYERFKSQKVTGTPQEILKGTPAVSLTFFEKYRPADSEFAEKPLQVGDRVVLFVADRDTSHWLNLSHLVTVPVARSVPPLNNDCQFLTSETAIIDLIKHRVALEKSAGKTKSRGLLVQFTAYTGQVDYADFVRTADPEYKATLIEQLQVRGNYSHGSAEQAIYNLISYPGKETADLIRPFLKDRTTNWTTTKSSNQRTIFDTLRSRLGIRDRDIPVYDISDAAYLALSLLGEKPKRPSTYYAPWLPRLFRDGFETSSSFPPGNWKYWPKDPKGNDVLP